MSQGVFKTIKAEMIAQTRVITIKFQIHFENKDKRTYWWVGWMWSVGETMESKTSKVLFWVLAYRKEGIAPE